MFPASCQVLGPVGSAGASFIYAARIQGQTCPGKSGEVAVRKPGIGFTQGAAFVVRDHEATLRHASRCGKKYPPIQPGIKGERPDAGWIHLPPNMAAIGGFQQTIGGTRKNYTFMTGIECNK